MQSPNFDEINRLHANFCSALADPSRIMLLYALAERPRSVNELAAAAGLSQSAASRHLKTLRERGLVRAVRQGPSVQYSLEDRRLIAALDLLREAMHDMIAGQASLLDEALPASAASAGMRG